MEQKAPAGCLDQGSVARYRVEPWRFIAYGQVWAVFILEHSLEERMFRDECSLRRRCRSSQQWGGGARWRVPSLRQG